MDSTWSPDIILIKRRLFRESLYNPGRTDQGLHEDSHIIKSPHSHLKKCDLFKDRTHALFNDFGTIKNATLNHSTISPWTFKETGQISTYGFDATPHQPNKQRLALNIPAFPQPTSLRSPHRTSNDKRQQPPRQQHQHLTMPATRSQARQTRSGRRSKATSPDGGKDEAKKTGNKGGDKGSKGGKGSKGSKGTAGAGERGQSGRVKEKTGARSFFSPFCQPTDKFTPPYRKPTKK